MEGHIRTTQQAWWLCKRGFLRKGCKKELHLEGDSIMEKRGGIYLPRSFYTYFSLVKFHLMGNWPSTLQDYTICPWISLRRLGLISHGVVFYPRGGMTWVVQGSEYQEWWLSSPRASTLTPANSRSLAMEPAKMAAEWSRSWMVLSQRREGLREIKKAYICAIY